MPSSDSKTSTLLEGDNFLHLITYIHEFYLMHGELPSKDVAVDHGVPEKLFKKAFKDEGFKAALLERGVNVDRLRSDDWTSKGLTPTQLLAANSLLDYTNQKSTTKKLQELGVSNAQYNAWLKDIAFQTYMRARAEELIKVSDFEINLALMDGIRAGDLRTIEYVNEMTGRFTRAKAGVNNVDVHGIIVKIIEIIDDELEDGDTKLRIGERLKKMISIQNTATHLLDTTLPPPVGKEPHLSSDGIEMPEVVKTRTPIELGNPNESLM